MRFEYVHTPVLIVGAGAAGLRAAIELAERGVECLVVGKHVHGDAHTTLAAGGINAVLGSLDPDDDWTMHAADTLREGHFICDNQAVEVLAREAPDRVRELQAWGCEFDLTGDGAINQRYFGAQSYRRTCFVGDRTGEAILRTLVERAAGVPYRQDLYVTRLLRQNGRVVGAAGFEKATGRYVVLKASAVLLAAGGLTRLYARSTSRPGENTGDAMALAFEAGARLKDMEFIQFHPTGMTTPEEWKGRLVTEAMRGEGGRLFNARGERFMRRYSSERLELDARDVVARAIYQEIREGRATEHGAVFLDVSHLDPELVRERLPQMVERFRGLGIDVTREPVEVAPTAHYAMGGIDVDFETGETSVSGLYAVGEATAGLHGANRLGGNSLAETVVFGRLTGAHLADVIERMAGDPSAAGPGSGVHDQKREDGRPAARSGTAEPLGQDPEDHFSELEALAAAQGRHAPEELIGELGELLWHHAGIIRDGAEIDEGLVRLQALRERAADLRVRGGITGQDFERANNLRFMLPVAEAILRSASMRRESRGAHFRKDAPEESSEWRVNVLVERGPDGSMHLGTAGVSEPAPEVREALSREHPGTYYHLE